MASGRRVPLLLGAALALLTLAAYLPTFHNGFVNLDDGFYVTGNPQVRAGITRASVAWALTANVANNWHPLTLLSHQLDVQLFGLDPPATTRPASSCIWRTPCCSSPCCAE